MQTNRFKVLLVDDDEISQLVTCTFLEKWNVEVAVASHGRQALELITEKTFQVVMMDLHMPGMDGDECTRLIRAMEDPYFKNIPIILFSASSTIDSKKGARELGMSDFITKPFLQEELRAKLSAYIPLSARTLRPLRIDFDAHTAGDNVFKSELLQLLIENLKELSKSLDIALATRQNEDFRRTSHKVATVFGILNDAEFRALFERLKTMVSDGEWQSPTFKKLISDFASLSSELISAMEHEIQTIHNNDPLHSKK